MANTQFGIFHTEYSRAKDFFFQVIASDYVNTLIVEGDYKSEDFAINMNEVAKYPDKKVWVGVTRLGFIIKSSDTVADTGESESAFHPVAKFLPDYRENVDEFIATLKRNGWYGSVAGFYMDEPLLWNITNDDLEEFTGYFRKTAAPDKRFFICFSLAGVAPEFWTINDVKPITPKSSQYLTDIAFDMYHQWSKDYEKILELMLKRAGNRKDLKVWMIPCTMNYRGNKTEDYCLEHLEGCYELLKKMPNKGGLMCFTYYTFRQDEEDLGNVGLDNLSRKEYKDYWPRLIERIKEIGREITSGKLD